MLISFSENFCIYKSFINILCNYPEDGICKFRNMSKLKNVVVSLKFILHLVLLRSFGNIIHDLAQKYEASFSKSDFRKLEKLHIKINKANEDINFLKNCQHFNVYPKFISFQLPNVDNGDVKFIRKRLLKSAIWKRIKEKHKLINECEHLEKAIGEVSTALDWYILKRSIEKNAKIAAEKSIRTHARKLSNLTKNATNPFLPDEIVTNLSSHKLSPDELNLLKNGLQHSIPPNYLKKSDIFTSFELIHRFLTEDLKDSKFSSQLKSDLSHLVNSYYYNYHPNKETLKKHGILKRLRNNKYIVVCKPDKGNGVVILDRKIYDDCILELISDKSKFKKLNEDVTIKREGQLQRFLRKLKKDGCLNDVTYNKIYPNGSHPARIYGLPKMHKSFGSNNYPKFRPIVSSIGTYNYNLAKFLCQLLSPLPSTYSCQDTFTFVKELKQVNFSNNFMVSFDVTSLFTNVPLYETIDIAVTHAFKSNPDLKISPSDLKKLFVYATAQTHFLFNDNYYDQIDGVAMGSPLAPVLANLFMTHHEEEWIKNYDGVPPVFYRRYVDDIFAVFHNETEAMFFFNYLNCCHGNIKFTIEKEIKQKLSFLDIIIDNSSGSLITSIFHKKTFTGLLTSFDSFTSFSYKIGLVKCLIDRAFKINNTWFGFHLDLEDIKKILQRNNYPLKIIDKIVLGYLNKQVSNADTDTKSENEQNIRYFKLPFIGKFSNTAQIKIKKLASKYCKSASVKVIFTSCKIGQSFSAKDLVPLRLRSNVIYKFSCAGCNACYIGETTRHFSKRIEEHLRSDKQSHIYKHLQENENCLHNSASACFSILDTAPTTWQLKLKEGMYIGWENPNLNKQVKYISSSLTV